MKPVSAVVAAVGVALVVGIVWVLGPGARWVLEHVDGVAIGDPSGLVGKDLAAALDAVRGRVLAVATGLAALVAVFYTARNADTARRTFRLGERGHDTDRYGKAVEQLGSTQAPVRLGGLYALEQLAQTTPALRQTIVDVICAYLRMPWTPPAEPDRQKMIRAAQRAARTPVTARSGTDGGRDPREERQVRLTAQRILADHLRYTDPPARRWWQSRRAAPDARHWPDMRLDLTGATLIDFDLHYCRISEARFNAATFTGDASFDGATFTGETQFDGATFTGHAWFYAAAFTGDAWFDRATFTSETQFDAATFTGHARFYNVTFTGPTAFSRTTFTDQAGFSGTTFTGGTWFDEATFTDAAHFSAATFTGHALFNRATFTGDAWFDRATFTGEASFEAATGLQWAELDGARVAPAKWWTKRVWPPCWQVADGADGWQTLRLTGPRIERGRAGPAWDPGMESD
ncbi:pentapeptide repeat-containing protein [Streptosporangium sandarakinum]|uniref:pentapeptide repeat-containing protein n=1 Tax=Streptosporangium sandarakinum TaxID=1260955 RepID=UPI00369C74E0